MFFAWIRIGISTMHGVMVYNHTKNKGNTSLILADSAQMKISKDKSYLTFVMFNGVNYDETNVKKYRDTTLQVQKIDFNKQEILIPLENYSFQKSDSSRFDDQVKSMKLSQLHESKDSIGEVRRQDKASQIETMIKSRALRYNSQLDTAGPKRTTPFAEKDILKWDDIDAEIRAVEKAKQNAEDMRMQKRWFSKQSSIRLSWRILSRICSCDRPAGSSG